MDKHDQLKKDNEVDSDNFFEEFRPRLESFKIDIENLSKFLVAVFAISYGIGLVILNLYLGQYGIVYLEFFKAEYVLIGLLWSFLVVITYAFWSVLFFCFSEAFNEIWRKRKNKSTERNLQYASALLIIGLFVFIIPYSIFEMILEQNQIFMCFVVLSLNTLFVSSFFSHFRDNLKFFFGKKSTKFQIFGPLLVISFGFVLIPVGLFSYSKVVYPKISTVWGGGKRLSANITLNNDKVSYFNLIGLQMKDNLILNAQIICETEKDYYLIVPNLEDSKKFYTIKINKETVELLIYK